jgi:ATP-dependent Clp protease ATP-binding subunit ClpC
MISHSHGFHYVTLYAASEAEHGHWEVLRRAHLFIGVCCLEKLLGNPQMQNAAGFKEECQSLQQVFEACSASAAKMRRQIRTALGQGKKEYKEGETVPLAPDSASSLHRALQAAATRGNREATSLDLLEALVAEPGDTLAQILTHFGYLPALQRAVDEAQQKPGTSVLSRWGRDLTELAAEGKLTPLIGRRHELEEVVRILLKRTKNNPVLVGEAGVGKTAIVEGLAQRIAAGKTLAGRRLVEVNLAALLAGTRYRGDLENRVSQLLSEVQKHPETILFIDEIHNVAGPGKAEGAPMDISEMLKPALARGDFSCIGATTSAEYRQCIEADPALERRFEPLHVAEPSPEETIELLKALASRYERHHNVTIREEAIRVAVLLSQRYMPLRRLPDKALDLLDTGCAQARFPDLSAHAVTPQNGSTIEVTEDAIQRVIAARTGIPISALRAEQSGLEHLDEELRERVVGQDRAVEVVTQAIRRARVGFRDARKPQAVLLLLGPSGVGKTFLAQALAEVLFGSADALVRFDMSEFGEPYSAAKLLGAPPGYVGYQDEGMLTARLREHPYAVVLLDEMDKADPRIWDVFLQLFDEGRITDAHGRTTLAQQCIFILTANLPPAKAVIGFEQSNSKETIPENFRRRFRPEFLNRIDAMVVFQPLSEESARRLVQQRLEHVSRQLEEKYQARLEADVDAVHLLARSGIDATKGARGLDRLIAKVVENPLTDLIFARGIQKNCRIRLILREGDTVEIAVEQDHVTAPRKS